MPGSGIGAGSVPALRPLSRKQAKQELGSVVTELKPQHRRRGLNSVVVQVGPWRGPTKPFFPLTRPVIAWDTQAASAFSCQRIVRATTWVTQPLSLKVTAIQAFKVPPGRD